MTVASPLGVGGGGHVCIISGASDLGGGQYLFVMLHLQSLQLTSLRAFPLTLVLCLMKLNTRADESARCCSVELF